MITNDWPQAPPGSVCFQCGNPAVALLPYYQGGKGWIQRPVCDLGDGHPAFEANEMAQDNCIGLDNCATARATDQSKYTTGAVR